MNPALITVIALGVVLVVAWDGLCLRVSSALIRQRSVT